MELSLHDFLIRHPGTLRVITLPKFSELSDPEQVMLHLVADRLDSAKQVGSKMVEESEWVQFCRLVGLYGFASLIAQRLRKLKQTEALADWPYLDQMTARIERTAVSETFHSASYDDSFNEVLRKLGPMSEKIVWIKGSSLRLMEYEAPEQRFCTDFDIVVREEFVQSTVDTMVQQGYQFIAGFPAFCNQLGLGPVSKLSDFLCVPSPHLMSRALGTMCHERHPAIDLKLAPFDRGLTLVEGERFWSDCLFKEHRGCRLRVPSKIDHLMICAVNYVKDGWLSWKSLHDVHLLANTLTEPEWIELIRRCAVEGISTDMWACLSYSAEIFSTAVPQQVLPQLAPRTRIWLRRRLHFTASCEFSWNSNSLPGLFLNAISADDLARKMTVISQSLCPTDLFIAAYYCRGSKYLQHSLLLARLVHFWLLMLPAFLVRKTFGRSLWDTQQQYAELGQAGLAQTLDRSMQSIH